MADQSHQQEDVHDPGKDESDERAASSARGRALANPQEAVGQIVGLMLQSPVHKHLFLNELEWLVLPAVMLKQFRLIHRKGKPIAYASWAYLGEDAAARFKSGVHKLQPGEWKTDDGELWLIDLLTPFGGQDAVLKELKDTVFSGQTIKTLQPAPDGRGVAMVEW